MKTAHYNKTTGQLLGWYDKDIHTSIPTPNIEVSEVDWKIAIDSAYNYVDATTSTLSRKDFRTQAQIEADTKEEINTAIQNLLDTTAQKYRYDNIMSARSYAGYTNPFQAEAQKLAVWASNCWVKAGQIEADVQNGVIPMPTVAEVLAQMPIYL